MSKNISLAINIVLAIAVAVLYYLHFKGESNSTSNQTKISASPDEPIVYVNSDSLLNNYEYYKELKKKAEAEGTKAQNDLQKREKAFENEVNEYQQKAGSMSNFERQTTEQSLAKQQQDLMMYKQQLAEKLATKEQDVTIELYDKIANYSKEYSKKTGHKVILAYSKGGGILFVNDSLDITTEILKGLNEEHGK